MVTVSLLLLYPENSQMAGVFVSEGEPERREFIKMTKEVGEKKIGPSDKTF